MQKISEGNIVEKFESIYKNQGYHIDIQAIFEMLLNKAIEYDIPVEDMPENILIICDVEFDSCWIKGNNKACFEIVEKMYKKTKYKMPKLIFWNVAAGSSRNFHIKLNQQGVIFIFGNIPHVLNIMTNINNEDFNPETIMKSILNNERYSFDRIFNFLS